MLTYSYFPPHPSLLSYSSSSSSFPLNQFLTTGVFQKVEQVCSNCNDVHSTSARFGLIVGKIKCNIQNEKWINTPIILGTIYKKLLPNLGQPTLFIKNLPEGRTCVQILQSGGSNSQYRWHLQTISYAKIAAEW